MSTNTASTKVCPGICDPGRGDYVLTAEMINGLVASSASGTTNFCETLKKGTSLPTMIGHDQAVYTNPRTNKVIAKNGVLEHDYTQWCGTTNLNANLYTAVCARTDYATTEEEKDKCCLGVDPVNYGPMQCPAKYFHQNTSGTMLGNDYCSDGSGATSSDCGNYIISRIKDPVFASTHYDVLKKDLNPSVFQNNFLELCKDPKSLTSSACSRFCQDPDNNKDGVSVCSDIISGYCKDKSPTDSEAIQNICGCYFNQSIYDTYYDSLNKKLNIAPGVLINDKQCFFPMCEKALYKPKLTTKCQDLNIVNCLNKVNIDNKGKITGNVIVNSKAECSVLKNDSGGSKKPDDKPDNKPDNGGSGGGGSGGGSPDNGGGGRPDNGGGGRPDNGGGDQPPNKPDVVPDKPSFWKTTPGYMTIAGIVMVSLMIFILLIAIIANSGSDE